MADLAKMIDATLPKPGTRNQWHRRLLTFGLGCLVSGGAASQVTPASTSHALNADEMLAIQSRVTDCEWKAADRYDDGHRAISDLARQVMGVCSVERVKAEIAFGVLNDPQIESIEFEQAVNSVEHARAARNKARKNSN
jgi:hypothetical protein